MDTVPHRTSMEFSDPMVQTSKTCQPRSQTNPSVMFGDTVPGKIPQPGAGSGSGEWTPNPATCPPAFKHGWNILHVREFPIKMFHRSHIYI